MKRVKRAVLQDFIEKGVGRQGTLFTGPRKDGTVRGGNSNQGNRRMERERVSRRGGEYSEREGNRLLTLKLWEDPHEKLPRDLIHLQGKNIGSESFENLSGRRKVRYTGSNTLKREESWSSVF